MCGIFWTPLTLQHFPKMCLLPCPSLILEGSWKAKGLSFSLPVMRVALCTFWIYPIAFLAQSPTRWVDYIYIYIYMLPDGIFANLLFSLYKRFHIYMHTFICNIKLFFLCWGKDCLGIQRHEWRILPILLTDSVNISGGKRGSPVWQGGAAHTILFWAWENKALARCWSRPH